jgi:hypothetical protein
MSATTPYLIVSSIERPIGQSRLSQVPAEPMHLLSRISPSIFGIGCKKYAIAKRSSYCRKLGGPLPTQNHGREDDTSIRSRSAAQDEVSSGRRFVAQNMFVRDIDYASLAGIAVLVASAAATPPMLFLTRIGSNMKMKPLRFRFTQTARRSCRPRHIVSARRTRCGADLHLPLLHKGEADDAAGIGIIDVVCGSVAM